MNIRKLYLVIVALLVVSLVLSACTGANAGCTDPRRPQRAQRRRT